MRRLAYRPEFVLTPHFSEVGQAAGLGANCFNSFVTPSVDKPLKRFSYTWLAQTTSLKC